MADGGVHPRAVEVFTHYYRLLESGETGVIAEDGRRTGDRPAPARAISTSTPTRHGRRSCGRRGQAQRRARHVDGHGPGQVAAAGARRAGASSTSSPSRCCALRERVRRRGCRCVLHEQLPHPRRHPGGACRATPTRRRRPAAGLPAEPRAQAAGRRPDAGRLAGRPEPGVVPARARRPLHRAGGVGVCSHAARRAASATRSSPTPTTSAPARTPRDRRLVRRRRRAVRRRGLPAHPRRPQGRAPGACGAATAGWCCARPRRPGPRTRRPAPTSTGTGSSTPTTCGSTCARSPTTLADSDGVLGLPLIRNDKTVDPADPSSPEVVQIETAMGAAVEVFDGRRRDRGGSAPVPAGQDHQRPAGAAVGRLRARPTTARSAGRPSTAAPLVDLDREHYKLIADFDARFPAGPPSLRGRAVAHRARRLDVRRGRRRHGRRACSRARAGRVVPTERGSGD